MDVAKSVRVNSMLRGENQIFKVIILVDRQYYATPLFFTPTALKTQQCELAKKLFGECLLLTLN